MKHRGPGGVNHWNSAHVALGHCMLRATPESKQEVQPLVDLQRGLALVMDGRLDNRRDLLGKLKPRIQMNAAPDSQFLLEAYSKWGEDCTRHLIGDFAFAIWDFRRQRLFCARDHVGAAGFAYHDNEDFFAFASESEALLVLPGVSAKPNEEYIACILVPAFENYGDRRSWQRDVCGLKPGESLTLASDGAVRIQAYWQFDPQEKRNYVSDQACQEHFLTVFGGAVRDRLRIEGDAAAMMSGGLDSAGILAMAHRLRPEFPDQRLHTYSAVDDDPYTCIESRCIKSLGASLDVSPHFVSVPSFRGMLSVDDLVETAWSRAHPVDNSILLPALMCLAASRNGCKVLINGVGGDMAMRVPRYYPAEFLRQGKVWLAWRECQAASRNNYFLQGDSPLSIFAHSVLLAATPTALQKGIRRVRRQRRASPLVTSLINPRFSEKLALQERLRDEFNMYQQALSSNDQTAWFRNILRLVNSGLSGYGHVAGRFGVEVRDPWSDFRVLDFFFRLPMSRKIRDGWTKYAVRSAFKEELAPAVRWRRDKSHLGWKFTNRLMSESHEMILYLMENELETIEEYVNVGSVRNLLKNYLEQKDRAGRQAIYELAVLIVWLKRTKAL